jgi:tRNA threonylcarbamoyladenosine biosynthesis protein TsaE
MTEKHVTVKLAELEAFAREFLHTLPSHDTATVVALSGDLGAGKTTFVKAIAKVLGVTEQVTSPTFTIMRGYETSDTRFKALVHMDAYRIENKRELGPLRFDELLTQPSTLFCIEWAEKIAPALPEHISRLTFTSGAIEDTRTIHVYSDTF